jgi:hypothetical protein
MSDVQIPRRRLHSTFGGPWFHRFSAKRNLTWSISYREMRPFIPYGNFYIVQPPIIPNTDADGILLQHCILTWIQQDSAKGQCPMCRQSKQAFEKTRGMYFPNPPSRVRVETGRRMKKGAGALLVCIASAQKSMGRVGSFLGRDTFHSEKQELVLLFLQSRVWMSVASLGNSI